MIRPLTNLWRRRAPRTPSLEIHIPISPTPNFFNMVRCLTQSLRRFGGAARDARVILTVGDSEVNPDLAESLPWLRPSGIELRWLPAERFRTDAFFATALERFCYDFTADVVLMLDADILVAGPLDELIRGVHERGVLAGVLGYVSPFEHLRRGNLWQPLFDHLGLGPAPLIHEHTGWGTLTDDPEYRHCPPYFNLGVVCAPREVMTRIGRSIYSLMYAVDGFLDSHFRCQLALAAAIAQFNIPCECLPLRYNFVNHEPVELRHAAELEQARFLHLNGPIPVPKDELFAEWEQLEAFVQRPGVTGVARRAQEVLAAILKDLELPLAA